MHESGEPAGTDVPDCDRTRAGVVVVVRFLMARTAVDQLKRIFRLAWLVSGAGLVLVFVRPLAGAVLLAVSLLLALARAVAVWVVERTALARAYRDVREELASAVEAGKANVRRELERVGLPSSRWWMPLVVLRLGRRSGEARARLEHVNLEQVLPKAQIDRAMTILDGVWSRAA